VPSRASLAGYSKKKHCQTDAVCVTGGERAWGDGSPQMRKNENVKKSMNDTKVTHDIEKKPFSASF